VKIDPVHLEIFDKIRRTQREHATQFPSVILFSTETTGPIFNEIFTRYSGISGAI